VPSLLRGFSVPGVSSLSCPRFLCGCGFLSWLLPVFSSFVVNGEYYGYNPFYVDWLSVGWLCDGWSLVTASRVCSDEGVGVRVAWLGDV
jgi:hypothetical protein